MDTSNTAHRTVDHQSRRREQRGWYFYDWANSAFSTTVVTVFLGPYLIKVAQSAAGADGFVHPLGIPVLAGSFFPYVSSLSVALQVLLLPLTGAVADRTQRKKQLLALLAYVGAVATMGLYLVQGSAYLLAGQLIDRYGPSVTPSYPLALIFVAPFGPFSALPRAWTSQKAAQTEVRLVGPWDSNTVILHWHGPLCAPFF